MFVFAKTVELILTPVFVSWLLMVVSLIAQLRNSPRAAIMTNVVAVAFFWAMSTSAVTNFSVRGLELRNVPCRHISKANAIVVLAGVTGRAYPPQPVPHIGQGGDRLLYAAELYREGRAPLVIFSGNQFESAEMAEIMELMGVPRNALIGEDTRLQNTYYAARGLIGILASHNVKKVLLVTSAIRMPRALAVFRHLGIDAIPAPTDFITRSRPAQLTPAAFLPNLGSLNALSAALHEWLGLLGYRLAGWT